jgi:orotate phosphoribosyltransferase
MNLFQNKRFILNSGKESNFKIECDALTDEDIECFAHLIGKNFQFSAVHGIPTGGVRLEIALRKYLTNGEDYPILIVDDVLTTGTSMEKAWRRFIENHHVIGVVLFARTTTQSWITPIFQMKVNPECM